MQDFNDVETQERIRRQNETARIKCQELYEDSKYRKQTQQELEHLQDAIAQQNQL